MILDNKLKNYFDSKGQNTDECIMYLLALKHGLKYRCSEETFQFLVSEKFIKLDLKSNTIIPLIGVYEGEVVIIPEVDLSVEQEVRDRVDEYRKLFKGIRSNSIGDKQKVIQLLTQFCLENNVEIDTIISVTKIYIDNTEYKLNADNFISRLDKQGVEVSALKTALEEYNMDSNDNGLWKVI